METIISLPFLPSLDLTKEEDRTGDGLTRTQLSYLGCVHIAAGPQTIDKLLQFLQENNAIEAYIDISTIESEEDILLILNAGAKKIFAKSTQLKALDAFADRVVPIVNSGDSSQAYPNGVLLDSEHLEEVEASLKKLATWNTKPIYMTTSSTDEEAIVSLAKEYSAVPIILATSLTVERASQDKISVSALIAGTWTSDRADKLIATMVTDEGGIALGLVYSDAISLAESLRTGTGVYQSRKRGLWYKGATSGSIQQLVRISLDCDQDCLRFMVRQTGPGKYSLEISKSILTSPGFCHLPQQTCFGDLRGIAKLEKTLVARKSSAPEGSYTARLFSDEKLLRAKIMEEAEELCDAKTREEVAFEAADLIYFALAKAVSAGVGVADIERNLDAKSVKVKRRQGDAKGKWAEKEGITNGVKPAGIKEMVTEAASAPRSKGDPAGLKNDRISMRRYNAATTSTEDLKAVLQRPSQRSTETIMGIVNPIIKDVQAGGDKALLGYTHKFEKATSLTSPVLKAPFPKSLMNLPPEIIEAIDISYENIRKFHAAQREEKPLHVETMPGIVCSRFARPIERVGLYVPGGTAVLPSTALMLGVPAMVAGCKTIVLASPPRADGSITPEIVYVAHKVGAEAIVLAGGAQAVAAMAYGTESVPKVDKILGPGNQFVTAAKMHVSNDTNAGVGIDMPAGPSEVLVIADKHANPAFVASDLLSQAEHGVDSQVVLIAIDLSEKELAAIEDELHNQAMALPRVDLVRGAIEHSVTLVVKDVAEAMALSNDYAPEHLILQMKNAVSVVDLVQNAGSVFIGEWTPESVGDYSAGVNHSLPTYGYAKQYSGVNLGSFTKHITSSQLTAQGLRNVGGAVMQLAQVEELEAHRRAVSIRIKYMDENKI
ncbi:histidinol dehydrogenase [Diplocarpon rosae]|nr:histidinol dehydrogenase [Diplocarpon rosae]